MYCLGVPETSPPSSLSPTIVKTTSPFGAEVNALDTVTELALNEDIVCVSILTSSDHTVCTKLPASSFTLEAFACVFIFAPSSSVSTRSP